CRPGTIYRARSVYRARPVVVVVDDQRRGAVRAGDDMPAIAAHDERGGATPIEEEDGLVVILERAGERLLERAAEDRAVAMLKLVAHVHDPHRWQRQHDRVRHVPRIARHTDALV